MKASVTFREEKSPLIRMKFPVTLAGFPLASGIVLGDNQDLALHLGTPPEACPSVKIAYQPNLASSPLSLILKAGIGPWGPPRTAALSISAELRFSKAASGPFFTVHVKPRLGDFSLRKLVKLASFGALADTPNVIKESFSHSQSSSQSRRKSNSIHRLASEAPCAAPIVVDKSCPGIFDETEAANKVMPPSSHGYFGDAPALTPLQLDKGSLYTPMPYRGQPFTRMHDGISEEADSVDNWGNDYVKIEDFDNSNRRFHEDDMNFSSKRSHDDRISNFNNFNDHDSPPESPLSASAHSGSCLNEQNTASVIKTADFLPVPWCVGVDESLRGWSLHAHTSLPLGSQTALRFRWGVNAHRDFLQGWDSQLSSFKLPFLHLQKISLMTTGFALETCKQGVGQLPTLPQYEEIHELSPVAALCGSMKRQLQLLYAENQVLKKAMEEMKAQFEQRSSGKSRRLSGNLEDVLAEEPPTDLAPEAKGNSKERKESFMRSQHDKGGSVSDKGKRNHGQDGLDALKKLGSLGRGGNGKSHHSMFD